MRARVYNHNSWVRAYSSLLMDNVPAVAFMYWRLRALYVASLRDLCYMLRCQPGSWLPNAHLRARYSRYAITPLSLFLPALCRILVVDGQRAQTVFLAPLSAGARSAASRAQRALWRGVRVYCYSAWRVFPSAKAWQQWRSLTSAPPPRGVSAAPPSCMAAAAGVFSVNVNIGGGRRRRRGASLAVRASHGAQRVLGLLFARRQQTYRRCYRLANALLAKHGGGSGMWHVRHCVCCMRAHYLLISRSYVPLAATRGVCARRISGVCCAALYGLCSWRRRAGKRCYRAAAVRKRAAR